MTCEFPLGLSGLSDEPDSNKSVLQITITLYGLKSRKPDAKKN